MDISGPVLDLPAFYWNTLCLTSMSVRRQLWLSTLPSLLCASARSLILVCFAKKKKKRRSSTATKGQNQRAAWRLWILWRVLSKRRGAMHAVPRRRAFILTFSIKHPGVIWRPSVVTLLTWKQALCCVSCSAVDAELIRESSHVRGAALLFLLLYKENVFLEATCYFPFNDRFHVNCD